MLCNIGACQPCDNTQFAPPGSKECKPRPACTSSDYYKSIAPCHNGTVSDFNVEV